MSLPGRCLALCHGRGAAGTRAQAAHLPNIIPTPHLAGASWENWKKAFRNSFDNIERVARGEKPLWVIPELRG
jgi:phosphoglycerate dehydrogenase-like enzyme